MQCHNPIPCIYNILDCMRGDHGKMPSTSPYAVRLWQRSIPDAFGKASLNQLSPALALPPSLVRSLAFSQLL